MGKDGQRWVYKQVTDADINNSSRHTHVGSIPAKWNAKINIKNKSTTHRETKRNKQGKNIDVDDADVVIAVSAPAIQLPLWWIHLPLFVLLFCCCSVVVAVEIFSVRHEDRIDHRPVDNVSPRRSIVPLFFRNLRAFLFSLSLFYANSFKFKRINYYQL